MKRDDLDFGIEVDRAAGSAHRTRVRPEACRRQGVDPPIVRKQRRAGRSSARGNGGTARRLPCYLSASSSSSAHMATHRPDPTALRQDDGDRLLLDHRRPVDIARRRRLRRSGFGDRRRTASLALARSFLSRVRCRAGLSISLTSSSRSLASASRSLPISISSRRAQAPQAHVEDRFGLAIGKPELRDHHRLGLVLGADDLDDPVEVEEGDHKAVEQLQPVVDLSDPRPRAAEQDLDLERQPGEQRLA